jgi:hypothetical protein
MAQTPQTDPKPEAPKTALPRPAPLSLAERRRLMLTPKAPEAPRQIFHDWAMI